MRIMATLDELDSAILSIDVSNNGENFAFGCRNGDIYVMQYKIDELAGDFEGYGESFEKIQISGVTGGQKGSKLIHKDISE